jgi:hypothetical protein
VLSRRYNHNISLGSCSLWAGVLISGCGIIGDVLTTKVIVGQPFTHSIEFPSPFRLPERVSGLFAFDQYTFRIPRAAPNILLVSACAYSIPEHVLEPSLRLCSPDAFAIDTQHGYVLRRATAAEWEQAVPDFGKALEGPARRTLKEELAKPVFLRPVPIASDEGPATYEGYKYRGKEYHRRGDWITSLYFADSDDGKIVVLAGVDKRGWPEHSILGDAVSQGFSGLITLDVFEGDPAHEFAALDVKSSINVNAGRRRMSLIDSRWIAIGLDRRLQKMLLLDFGPIGGKEK